MKYTKLAISFICLICALLLFASDAFAIKSNKNKSKEDGKHIEMAQAEQNNKLLVSSLSFDEVLNKAKAHSYDIKIADFDILISKQDITIARSEYMPKLYFGANNEYNKNFNDYSSEDGSQKNSSSYVGDTFVNPYTRFQSLLGITLLKEQTIYNKRVRFYSML